MNAISIQKKIYQRCVCLTAIAWLLLIAVASTPATAQVAVRGETIYTSAGEPIKDGTIVIRDGKIFRAGSPEDLGHDPEVREIYLGEGFRLD